MQEMEMVARSHHIGSPRFYPLMAILAPLAATGITRIRDGAMWERNELLTCGFLLHDRCQAYIHALL